MHSSGKATVRGLVFALSFSSAVCWGGGTPAADAVLSSQDKPSTRKEITGEHIPVLVYSSEELKDALVEFRLADLPELPVSGFEVVNSSGYVLPYQIDDLDNSNSLTSNDGGVFSADLDKGLNIVYFLINQGNQIEITKRWDKNNITVKGSSYQATINDKGGIGDLRFVGEEGNISDWAIKEHKFGFKDTFPINNIKNISFCSGPLRTLIIAGGEFKSKDTKSNFYSLYRIELMKDFITYRYSLKFLDDRPVYIPGQIHDFMAYNTKYFTRMKYLGTEGHEIKRLSHGGGYPIVWSDLEGEEYGLVELKKRPLRNFQWWNGRGISRKVFYSWPGNHYCEGDEIVDETMLFPYLSKNFSEIESLAGRFKADICASSKIEALDKFVKLKKETAEYDGYLNKLKIDLSPLKKESDMVKDMELRLEKVCSLWQSGKVDECKRLFNRIEDEFIGFKGGLRESIYSAVDNYWLAQKKDIEKGIGYLKNEKLNFATPELMLSCSKVCKNAAKLYLKKMDTPLGEICKSENYPRAVEEIERSFSLCKDAKEAIKTTKEEKIRNLMPGGEVKNPLFFFSTHTGFRLMVNYDSHWATPMRRKQALEFLDEYASIGLDVLCSGLHLSAIRPEEGKFNLEWMKEVVAECKKRDVKLVPHLALNTTEEDFGGLKWFREKYKDDRPMLAMEKYVGTLPVYDMLDEYQKAVMEAIGNEPNIIAWCGNNESQVRGRCYDEYSIKSFRGWLKDKHQTINHLNECWGTEYSQFEEVNPPDYKQRPKGKVPAAIWYDWILFRCQAMGSTEAIVTRLIQKNDPLKRPASPRGLSETFMIMGPDSPYEGLGSHYNMFSSDWWYFDEACRGVVFFNNYTHGPYELPWMVNGVRSASRGEKPIIITEGAPCWKICPFYHAIVMPKHLNWYWQAVGQGLKGVFFFSYATSDTDLYALYHRDGSPKDSLVRIGEMNQIAKVLKPLLADAKPQKAEVAIYFPRATMIHDDGDRGFLGRFFGKFFQPWLSLYKSGIAVKFLAMDTIDEVKDYKVLILPSSAYLEEKCISPVKEFVKDGGLLIAEGALSFWDEYGRTHEISPGDLGEVFGATIDTSGQTDTQVEMIDRLLGHQVGAKIELSDTKFSYSLQPTTGEVLAKYSGSGKPAIIHHRYHKGTAILFGFPSANLKEDLTHPWLTELWGDYIPRGHKRGGLVDSVIKLGKVSPPIQWKGNVEASVLWNGQIPIIMAVSNFEKDEQVELTYNLGTRYRSCRWFDILTSEDVTRSEGSLDFRMTPYQVRIIVPEEG